MARQFEFLDVAMPWVQLTTRRPLDPGFRATILRIYEHRCAVCGWDAMLDNTDLALEAVLFAGTPRAAPNPTLP